MQTMERLGVYFVLNRAREQQGFDPEKYGLSEAEAVTIARMFTKCGSTPSLLTHLRMTLPTTMLLEIAVRPLFIFHWCTD